MDEKSFITTGFHIPYNPALKERARELRKNMTEPEKRLWFSFLRKLDTRFLRQKPLDNYIVDFYCSTRKLVIEIDGDSHYSDEARIYDERRSRILGKYGLRVLRFTNIDIMKNFENVCEEIGKYLDVE